MLRSYVDVRLLCCLMLLLIIYYVNHIKLLIENKPLYVIQTDTFVNDDPPNKVDKYILLWTSPKSVPFKFAEGQSTFIEHGCMFTNCYLYNNRSYLNSSADWDAIVFRADEYTQYQVNLVEDRPQMRSSKQRYILSCFNHIPDHIQKELEMDSFFNWTWTHRDDSDIPFSPFAIKDEYGHIIGPRWNIQWKKELTEISEEKKKQFRFKTKAAASLVTNCNSLAFTYVKRMQDYLKQFNLTVDIYGNCGVLRCGNGSMIDCLAMIGRNYYFLMVSESLYKHDYVSKNYLYAVNNKAVPIMLGPSDYSRFAHPESYINACKVGSEQALAELMQQLIQDPERYASYFRWTNHYSYSMNSPEVQPACRLCFALNDPLLLATHKSYPDMKAWWSLSPKQSDTLCVPDK